MTYGRRQHDVIDLIASPHTEVEIQREYGLDTFKLYVHEEGRTVVRVGKLKEEQIKNRSDTDFLAGEY